MQLQGVTFEEKEPETLEWIDRFGGGTLYDIGANVGIYSVYYAKRHAAPVYAFEPSVFNLEVLVRNLDSNQVGGLVTVLPIALTSAPGILPFELSSTEFGGASSTFGEGIGFDGKPLPVALRYLTFGSSIDHLLDTQFICSLPSLTKIDVDGIEHLVLEGAEQTLQSTHLKSVLIEVNRGVPHLYEPVRQQLSFAGFKLASSSLGSMFVGTQYEELRNEVWVRN